MLRKASSTLAASNLASYPTKMARISSALAEYFVKLSGMKTSCGHISGDTNANQPVDLVVAEQAIRSLFAMWPAMPDRTPNLRAS